MLEDLHGHWLSARLAGGWEQCPAAGWAPRRSGSQLAFQAAESVAGVWLPLRSPSRWSGAWEESAVPDGATLPSLADRALSLISPFRRLREMRWFWAPQSSESWKPHPVSRPSRSHRRESTRPRAYGPGPLRDRAGLGPWPSPLRLFSGLIRRPVSLQET